MNIIQYNQIHIHGSIFPLFKKKKSKHKHLQTSSNIAIPMKSHHHQSWCSFWTRSSRILRLDQRSWTRTILSLRIPSLLPRSILITPLSLSNDVERPILLVLVLESAGRGRTAGERLEKRRKCRFPREQKLPQGTLGRPFHIGTPRSVLGCGGRRISLSSTRWRALPVGGAPRSPNADYALFILYKREQPCTGLPQFVRTGSRETQRT